MLSVTMASLGLLGLHLSAVSAFHVPVPVQARNMRTAVSATESTSEHLHSCNSEGRALGVPQDLDMLNLSASSIAAVAASIC